ncbi:hypothetical protein [Actinomadura madurae]|nr:hypothetical protein [Actinomadura madurae]MCP9954686.1 hypothetical protein [Actinomadura madurae]MCP9971425.1 hypothetical protein [Actinomadura madurae]MCP9983915.1 hypothetical protein [Actinomadura madurae]MCQ0004519.1 hypothetical protein [Actinomadura madurae]MCQ0020148.1 hypothetical protein [Actinomadura madurae]
MSGKAYCPTCRSDRNVSYGGREGGTGRSSDVWRCTRHGEFKTPAR